MAETYHAAQAEQIVQRYAFGAILPGIIPIPWLDAAIISGVQLQMLHSLAKLYGTTFSTELARAAIASLVGGGASVSLAMIATQLLRPVPVIGQFAGLATTTAFGAGATYAVGRVFIQHFESGGTLLTFDPEKVRAHYRKLFEEVPARIASGSAGIMP